jgi:Transposase and inactivated derivatives
MNMNFDVYIEENSQVRLLNDVIDEIYFTKDYTVQSEWTGGIPEDIMMKILIFGYMNGAFSSRKIEQLCKRDIYFWWLLDGFKKPDHCTISRFRKKMGDQIERVFYDVVKYLLNMGEISGENLFIDGTKLEANANRYTFVWKKAVSKNEQKLRSKLPAILDEIYSAHDVKFPENTPVPDMISTLSSLMNKFGISRVTGKGHHKSSYQKALEKLEEYYEKMSLYERYNSLFDGRNSFSKTDTDATFMRMKDDHMKNGQLKPGYNIQSAVEGEYIVGIDVSSERSDVNTLIPFLEKFNSLELFVLKNIICDAGYESEENYLYLKSHNLTSYIKPVNYEQQKKKNYRTKYGRIENMEYHETGDIFVCKAGRILRRVGTKHEKSKTGFVSEKVVYRCESCEGCPYNRTARKRRATRHFRYHTGSKNCVKKAGKTSRPSSAHGCE